jgi:hypothetical protein
MNLSTPIETAIKVFYFCDNVNYFLVVTRVSFLQCGIVTFSFNVPVCVHDNYLYAKPNIIVFTAAYESSMVSLLYYMKLMAKRVVKLNMLPVKRVSKVVASNMFRYVLMIVLRKVLRKTFPLHAFTDGDAFLNA